MPPSNNQIEKRLGAAAQAEPVSALGDSAFLHNGTDAHEV